MNFNILLFVISGGNKVLKETKPVRDPFWTTKDEKPASNGSQSIEQRERQELRQAIILLNIHKSQHMPLHVFPRSGSLSEHRLWQKYMHAFGECWQDYGRVDIKSLSPAEISQHLVLFRNAIKVLDEAANLLQYTKQVRSFGDTLTIATCKRISSVIDSLNTWITDSCSYQKGLGCQLN